jgi:hypothetical protein
MDPLPQLQSNDDLQFPFNDLSNPQKQPNFWQQKHQFNAHFELPLNGQQMSQKKA